MARQLGKISVTIIQDVMWPFFMWPRTDFECINQVGASVNSVPFVACFLVSKYQLTSFIDTLLLVADSHVII